MTQIRLPSASCHSKCEGTHEFHFDPPAGEVVAQTVESFPEDSTTARWMMGETLEPGFPPLGDIPLLPRREAE